MPLDLYSVHCGSAQKSADLLMQYNADGGGKTSKLIKVKTLIKS